MKEEPGPVEKRRRLLRDVPSPVEGSSGSQAVTRATEPVSTSDSAKQLFAAGSNTPYRSVKKTG